MSFLARARPILVVALLLVALAGCQSLPSVATPEPSLELTLLHTNDTWGYVDPCG